MNKDILQVAHLMKTYSYRGVTTEATRNVSFVVPQGEFCVIMGASGGGKTTLLNLISGVDRADAGDIVISDEFVTDFSMEEFALFRRDHIGIVFQDFNLIDSLNVTENIILPMHLDEMEPGEAVSKANDIMEQFGILKLRDKWVYELSGGEQQRVAICRALINDPQIILADEPTGNLDSRSSSSVMECFEELNKRGITILMVTHDPASASYGDRILYFQDGTITYEIIRKDTRENFYQEILYELSKREAVR